MSKILIVEDDRDVTEVMKMAFEKKGYKVSAAYDGKQALEMIYENKPDLIVLDLMLPKINGHTVSLRLKENTATANIPVIVITGKGTLKELLSIQE
ncbi:MAG: response regulator, partial [Elusimicrobiota bacterium]|nr:response regulator [Elusimicrobiota bacterium]